MPDPAPDPLPRGPGAGASPDGDAAPADSRHGRPPGDRDNLDIDNERRRLGEALAELERDGRVQLTWIRGGTWRELQSVVRRGRWHIFHFIGHGGFDPETDEGLILLEDDDGNGYPLHAGDPSLLLCDHHSLRMVLLNACETGRASALDSFSSTAGTLVRRGIPAVLAMQYEITDRAAVEFARSFYGALASQLPVDASVTEARRAVKLAQPRTLERGTPVLFLRSPDGHIFKVGAPSEAPVVRSQEHHAAEEALPDQLAELYTEGLSAFYTKRWAEAVELFREIIAQRPGYEDAAAKLDEARRQQALERRYKQGRDAQVPGD